MRRCSKSTLSTFTRTFQQETFGDKLKFALQRFEGDKPFDRVGQLGKQPEGRYARDYGLVVLSDFVAHIHGRI